MALAAMKAAAVQDTRSSFQVQFFAQGHTDMQTRAVW